MADITLTILKNPFNLSDREIKKVGYTPGKTVIEYVRPMMKGINLEEMVFSHNGVIVDNERLNSAIVESGDYIALCATVGKGGSGKNILRMIATVALMAYTGNIAAGHGWGATLGGAGSWGASLAAGAISAVGGMLINHMFPQPTPEITSADMTTSTPTYSWGSLQSLSGQGNALAVTYGTMRTAGQILAQHITNGDGDKQYLNLLLCGGEGSIDSITDIKINDNPIANYHDVVVDIRLGSNDQTVIPNFNDTYADQQLGYELVLANDWSTYQTEGNGGEALEITLECPNGLYYANDQGGLDNATVTIQGQYRKAGAQDWINWNEWIITAAKNSAVRKVYRIDNLPAAKYEVRCRCISKSGDSTRYSTKVYWTQLSHIIYDDFARPSKVLVGIKALATDQLSGGLPSVTWLQSVETVNVYNPLSGQYEKKSARNSAWAAYDLLHHCKKIRNTITKAEEYKVFGIPANRIDYQAFADWAAFCTERNLNFEYIFDTVSDLWSSLQKPESVGRGKVILKGTRYSCICDRPTQPVQLFTMGNMMQDKFQEDFLGIKDRANAVEISFVNKDKGYQKDVLTIYGDNWDDSQIIQNPTQITLYGCTSYQQAYREGKYRLRLNQYLQRTISFDADIDAIACQVGDVILIQHDIPQWGYGGRIVSATENTIQFDRSIIMEDGNTYSVMVRLADDTIVEKQVLGIAEETDTVTVSTPFSSIPQKWDIFSFGETNKVTKPFRVLNISRSQEFKRSITALEYVEGVYTEVDTIPVINYSDLDNSIPEVGNLNLGQQTYRQKDGTIISEIDCSWVVPKKYIKNSIVWYSRDAGQTWFLWGNTTNNLAKITGVKSQETYLVKVSTLNSSGVVSPGVISKEIYITGKDQPPSNIDSIAAEINSSDSTKLILKWSAVTDIDLKGYQLSEGGRILTPTPINDNQYIYTATSSRKYNFSIVAIDNSGNPSTIPATVSINIIIEPAQVAGFVAIIQDTDRSLLNLSWVANQEKDLAYYEIRVGDDWSTAMLITTQLKSTTYTHALSAEGSQNFMIKAVSIAGYESLQAAKKRLQITLRPNAPTSLEAIQDTSDRSKLILSWIAPAGHDIMGYDITFSSQAYFTKETTYTYAISESGTYEIVVKARTVAGYQSNTISKSVAVSLEPGDVTGFTISQDMSDHSLLHLKWDNAIYGDLAFFEIREGVSWDAGILVVTGLSGLEYNTRINQEREYSYWIKAVSRSGKYSQYPINQVAIYDLNPVPVTNILVTQDTNDRSLINVEWTGISELDFAYYDVRSGQTWEDAIKLTQTKETKYQFRPTDGGNVKILIKAISNAGFYSDEATGSLYALMEPQDVQNFIVQQNGEYVELYWDRALENDVVGFEIREGWTFDFGQLIETNITGNSYKYKVDFDGIYHYWIKAINRSNRYSVTPIDYQLTVVDLPPKNVIQSFDEIVMRSGTHTETEFGVSDINWQTIGGQWNDYSTTKWEEVGGRQVLRLKKDVNGNYPATGTYMCEQIDVGRIITANIAVKFLSTVKFRGETSAILQMRTSKDNVDWSVWKDFLPAKFVFRYIELRVILSTSNSAKTPEVNRFDVMVDLPDIEKAGTMEVPIGGIRITYNTDFYIVPVVTPYAIGTGVHVEITNRDKTGFNARILNLSNQDIGGTMDWRARGY